MHLVCQRNKSQYPSNPNPDCTVAPLAGVPSGVGPNIIKDAREAGMQFPGGAGFPARVPRGSRRRCGIAGPGARLSGVLGPPPPPAAPVSAASGAGLGNWCVQLPCPPPGQGQVRAGGAQPGFRTVGLLPFCFRRSRGKEIPFTQS